jgi:hypothetical protein
VSLAADLAPWFAMGKDVVLACAGAFGAWVAYRGVDAWRRETVGKAHFEAARVLLMAAYRTRDAILAARSPLTWMPAEPRDPEGRAKAWTEEFERRWKPIQEAGRELEAAAVGAEALFGADAVTPVSDLRGEAMSMRASMAMYVQATREEWKNDETMRRIRADVFGLEESTMAAKVSDAIKALESALAGHLRRDR